MAQLFKPGDYVFVKDDPKDRFGLVTSETRFKYRKKGNLSCFLNL